MEGDYDAKLYSKLNIYIKKCKSDLPNYCKSDAEIEKKLQFSFFSAFFPDKVIDPTNLNNPFQIRGRDIFTTISTKQGKYVNLYFTNSYI
jgi:hypothetical protein